MTTLAGRPGTALMVIDVQEGVVAQAYQRDAVVANIGKLVDKARQGRDVRRLSRSAGDPARTTGAGPGSTPAGPSP
jgi:nicotinamidase-related amidase